MNLVFLYSWVEKNKIHLDQLATKMCLDLGYTHLLVYLYVLYTTDWQETRPLKMVLRKAQKIFDLLFTYFLQGKNTIISGVFLPVYILPANKST